MGPELADAYLLQHIFRWNTNAAVNHLGAPDYGCYSLDLLDLLQVCIPAAPRIDARRQNNLFP